MTLSLVFWHVEHSRLVRRWQRYVVPGCVPRVGDYLKGEAEELVGDDEGRDYQVTAVFWDYSKNEVVVQVK